MTEKRRTIIEFGFVFLVFAFLIFIGPQASRAAADDFFRGWIWNDHIGWISMNCADTGTCAAVDYGVDMDLSNGNITGYAWSENAGWICFGSTCAGVTPQGGGSYAGYASSTGEIGGWAKMEWLNMPSEGWISLNCANPAVCGASNYKTTISTFDNTDVGGWAWNGNGAGANQTGLGWFDFSRVIGTKEFMCQDLLDNDADGLIDCADPDCPCALEMNEPLCTDGIDNDGDVLVDCLDNQPNLANSCWHHDPYCPTNEALAWLWDGSSWVQPGGSVTCHDGSDNDYDGVVNGAYDQSPLTGRDCFDADCAPFCTEEPENCADGFDNNWNGLTDCDDPICAGTCSGFCEFNDSPCDEIGAVCYEDPETHQKYYCKARPWLETKYGQVYGQLGVEGPAAPEGMSNATFCVIAATGGIANFTSEQSCYISPEDVFGFPSQLNKYTNILGNLDIAGIISGLYGDVVPMTSNIIPPVLNGKIYYWADGDLNIQSAIQIADAIGNGSGAGLIIVRGDIRFDYDVIYGTSNISKLKQLASIGWIALRDPVSGLGGNIYIGNDVNNLVGAFYAEEMVQTDAGNVPLLVNGLMISKKFDFNRVFSSGAQGAERIIFDGRALTNPPPGMEDLTRSLPSIQEVVPTR
ncbi:MAG: hypothetical protein PHW53_03130 [Patescibacteria group bacterium]|nr:hypothetical protein [Patescibacteria group bacterium]